MTVKQEVQYKTSDGREFSSESEAQKHDALIVARREYEAALSKLNRLVAETKRTADGELFQFGMWRTYYYITPGFFDMPALAEVPYLGSNWDLNEYDDAVEIVTREGTEQRRCEYRINKLYANKTKALRALVEAQAAWLKEREEQISQTKAKVLAGLDPTRG